MSECACGSKRDYSACCESYILGKSHPSTAEGLMRSRYTAFTLGEVGYIYDSVHPSKRDDHDRESIRTWSQKSTWHGLEILETQKGSADDSEGTVEFAAHYNNKKGRQRHHELASFRKYEGHWYFYDGKQPSVTTVVREAPKVGRNDPCPCGSGKKYKKCCAGQ